MKFADFEESEYRGPLYNQLEWGNHLVWEPGQVFEKHIGIDRSAYCTNDYLWGLHGYDTPLNGVLMHRRHWLFIWSERKKKKSLPNFKLNLFLQAKRPIVLTSGNKNLKTNGIKGGCWKFETTEHQQIALEKLEDKLRGEALVCYASPVFHKQSDLYKHTTNRSIVENSTFPSITSLKGHTAWYYDTPGAVGCANPVYERINEESLVYRINQLVESASYSENEIGDGRRYLSFLAKAILELSSECEDYYESAILSEATIEISRFVEEHELEDDSQYVKDYLLVREFCFLYKLQWFVLGASNKALHRTSR
ncbi:hypothetical protein P9K38_08635 [Pseudomonas sp. 905_Psudmo1]|nr:hypothetical protein [Pseudomonas sp. 905_Psudmo1]WFS20388.1 hypothetical protein P9K38_08635 [Pseudomonas sp. 905_Psudmo1]